MNGDRQPTSPPAGPNAPQEGFGRLEREIALLLRRARVISQRLSGELHPDLDGSAYGLLALLQDLGPLRAGDLVARLGQDKSTVSRQVTKLVELGLVDRTADPVDGRAQVLAPSPEGSAGTAWIRAARRARWEADLADWPADDVATLGELLARLNRLGEARDDVRPGEAAPSEPLADGTIQPSTGVACRTRRAHEQQEPRLQPNTFRNSSPSWPAMPTAAAAIARFCGLTILPMTPPEVLAAASSTGSRPAAAAVCTCRAPNSALAEVSEPVTATPIQPRMGDRNTKKLPVSARHPPRVLVWPDWFMT